MFYNSNVFISVKSVVARPGWLSGRIRPQSLLPLDPQRTSASLDWELPRVRFSISILRLFRPEKGEFMTGQKLFEQKFQEPILQVFMGKLSP
jgi:hypothetical protein